MTFTISILKIINRRKILILTTLLILYYVIDKVKLRLNCKSELKSNLTENILCYNTKTGDALRSAEEENFSPKSNSIFFHETSCRGGLNSRQACTVESAARAHPHYQIHVLFSAPIGKQSLTTGNLKALQEFKNINFSRVHLDEYAKGTPLESLVSSGALNRTRWPISHSSDVLRYLTLYKWGGVYLDLDAVVARPLTSLANNWAARENNVSIASGAMSFSRDEIGRIFAEASVRHLASNFKGDVWNHNGPGVVTRVLKELCSTSVVADMSATTCKGFEVYDRHLFYPLDIKTYPHYFDSAKLEVLDPFTYHIFNSNSFKLKVLKDSNYAKIAKDYCPTVYANYGDNFGE